MRSRQFTGPARALRGVVLGAMLFVLTVSAHTSAGGEAHGLRNALWLLPVTILLSTALTDRRRGIVWLTIYLVGAQALFHVLLSVSLQHGPAAVHLLPSGAMIAAHVVAAVAAAVALHHADALLHRWLAFVETVARGHRLWVVSPPPVHAVHPVTSCFTVVEPRTHGWLALRAPPVVPA